MPYFNNPLSAASFNFASITRHTDLLPFSIRLLTSRTFSLDILCFFQLCPSPCRLWRMGGDAHVPAVFGGVLIPLQPDRPGFAVNILQFLYFTDEIQNLFNLLQFLPPANCPQ
jgi:hypothetical protein